MSVRDAMLAILTLGPAYGSQLHAELTSRTPHRSPVNVGQIYTTIDRLGAQKLLTSGGVTDDGLPLHRLTPSGRGRAEAWMSGPDDSPTLDWTEMLDQVLVTASVDDTAAGGLIAAYRELWSGRADEQPRAVIGEDVPAGLTALARHHQAVAAVEWLDAVGAAVADPGMARPFSEGRPRRGRPSTAAPPPAT